MKKIFIFIVTIFAICLMSINSFANTLSSYSESAYLSNKQAEEYKFVKKVNVYKLSYGRYVSDGQCEIYKNSKNYLFLKSPHSRNLYPVYNTKYPHSQFYKSTATDEWGYTVFFNMN